MANEIPKHTLRALLGPVPDAVVKRGRGYFNAGAVTNFDVSVDIAFAVVNGSMDYEVVAALVVSAYDDNDCTCPYFEDHGVCKHLVAVLYEANARGVLGGDSDAGAFQSAIENLTFMLGDSVMTIHRPKPSEAAAATTKQPTWRERLGEIAVQHSVTCLTQVVPEGAELMYILAPPPSHAADQLVVEVGYRQPLQDGRWSVMKPLNVKRRDLPSLPTEADRRALAILMGAPMHTTGSYGGYSYDNYAPHNRPFTVPDAAQAMLLNTIGPTGRCYLRQGDQKNDLTPLAWDGGAPWQTRVRVEPIQQDQPNGDYRLAMALERSDRSLSIHDPHLLTAGGIMVHEGRLSRVEVEDPGRAAWLRAERSSPQAQLRARAGKTEITVPRDDAGAMLEQLLSLPGLPELSLPEELSYETIQNSPQPRLVVQSPEAGHWDKRLNGYMQVGYEGLWIDGDDPRAGVFDVDAHQLIQRDADAEQALSEQLFEAGLKLPAESSRDHRWHFVLQPKQLPDIAAALTRAGWQVEADGKPYRGGAEMDLTVTSGIDWFELHGEARFGDQTAALPELLKALQSGSRTILLDDGSQGVLPEDWLTRYGMLGEFGRAEDEHLRFELPQAVLLDAMLSELPGVDIDRQFKQVRDRIKRSGKAKPKAPPRSFKGELRPYQREGLGWMHQLGRLGLGGCLADDMGLGKTVQVLALLEARRTAKPADRPEHPALVVVPKSLIFNWQQEAQRFAPNLKVLNHTGKERFDTLGLKRADLEQAQDTAPLGDALHAYDLVLTTYGTLRRDIPLLKDIRFDYAALDEAQAIKNANTASAKAARLIHADHRLALSGTPIENHLGELWSLFAYLNPGMLGQSKLGKQLQSKSSQVTDDTRQVLSQALRPYILRRTKAQVATDLPDKTEQTLYCELPPKQRKHYNQLRDHYRDQLLKRIDTKGLAKSKIQVLEALLRLRQAACHPALINPEHKKAESAKLDQLVPQLQSIIDEGHKALVFSQFTQMLGLLRQRIDPLKVNYEYLDGKTRKRQGKVKRFQDDPDCKLFLISLKAGGTGLNLTAADYVFLLDPWWNPAVEAQAIDRTHRIGQDKQVFAYRLIAKDTVEEKVIELQQTKRELADAIIGQDNATLRDLTREDLELLLG